MIFRRIIFWCFLGAGLASCALDPISNDVDSLSLIELAATLQTQEACELKAGSWRKLGKLQRYACVLTAEDAGKTCVDSSECQIACEVEATVVSLSETIEGRCRATTNPFGCRATVSQGRVESTLCVD